MDRWKESFLVQYKKYLNPAGVENAQASNGRLVRSLEKLAKTVVTVNDFVKAGKISKENQSVQGQRHLTNMTEQMASSEKEIARFMPTTGADEEEVGYDKFELGAVLIEDGFHVYEYLKTTKDIIEELQEIILKNVLSSNKLSIVQFYLRQIQTFCDVMADLGLFGLMETILEFYKVKPRTKTMAVKAPPPPKEEDNEEGEIPLKPERVLDPNKKYKFRAAYTGGYVDPFSGTQPGRHEFEDPDDEEKNNDDPEGEGEDDDNHFVVFFDMKTGAIGKIPRKDCKSSNLFVSENDKGEEQIVGEVTDPDEKEQLVWDMKKAMKGNAPPTPKQGPKRTSSAKSSALMRDIKPPLEGAKKAPTRTRSSRADHPEKSSSLVEPSARKELMKTRSGGLLELRASTRRAHEESARNETALRHDLSGTLSDHTKAATSTKQKRPSSVHESTSSEAKTNAAVRRASTPAAPSPSADGWAKPAAIAATRRSHKVQPVTKQAPSSTGWSNPSTLAAKRRDG